MNKRIVVITTVFCLFIIGICIALYAFAENNIVQPKLEAIAKVKLGIPQECLTISKIASFGLECNHLTLYDAAYSLIFENDLDQATPATLLCAEGGKYEATLGEFFIHSDLTVTNEVAAFPGMSKGNLCSSLGGTLVITEVLESSSPVAEPTPESSLPTESIAPTDTTTPAEVSSSSPAIYFADRPSENNACPVAVDYATLASQLWANNPERANSYSVTFFESQSIGSCAGILYYYWISKPEWDVNVFYFYDVNTSQWTISQPTSALFTSDFNIAPIGAEGWYKDGVWSGMSFYIYNVQAQLTYAINVEVNGAVTATTNPESLDAAGERYRRLSGSEVEKSCDQFPTELHIRDRIINDIRPDSSVAVTVDHWHDLAIYAQTDRWDINVSLCEIGMIDAYVYTDSGSSTLTYVFQDDQLRLIIDEEGYTPFPLKNYEDGRLAYYTYADTVELFILNFDGTSQLICTASDPSLIGVSESYIEDFESAGCKLPK